MNQVTATARALVSRRWRWVTLVVILLMLVLGRLGVWQLSRLAERRLQNVDRAAALAAAPLDLNRDDTLRGALSDDRLAELTNRDAVVSGAYDVDNQLVVKLQTYNGEPGVRLITPLLIDGGEMAVLVDRGWIADADVAAGNFYTDGLEGAVTVNGYLAPPEIITRQGAGSSVPSGPLNEIFRVDIAGIQQAVPYSLAPMYLRAAPEGDETTPPVRVPKEVDLSDGPHLGYAVQWFIFSIGLGVAYVIFVNHKLRTEPREEARSPVDGSATSQVS